VKPEGHAVLNIYAEWRAMTEAEVDASKHRCVHGRSWI
jgi:hypothetical protein